MRGSAGCLHCCLHLGFDGVLLPHRVSYSRILFRYFTRILFPLNNREKLYFNKSLY